VGRRVHTADDVLRHALTGASELVVAPGDRLTPLAWDVAHERQVRVTVGPEPPGGGPDGQQQRGREGARHGPRPRVRHVAGVHAPALDPFPVELHRPEMDVRLRDVVGAADGLPMAVGVMSLREGSFPWTLDYDEVEYVIEGELHITTADQAVVGHPGDVIAVPKGSSITFGTPSWTRFLYVTYPADWGGAA
jgi:ethanolamine utilization protein EutQ